MIDKLKKTWYNLKKRVKERLPCQKKKKSVLQSVSLLLSVLLFVPSLNLLTSSAESIVSQDLTDYLDTFMDSVEVGEAFQAMGIDGKKAAAVYFATVTMLNEINNNAIVAGGDPVYTSVTGYYQTIDDTIYIGILYPSLSDGSTFFKGSSGVSYTLKLEALDNIFDYDNYISTSVNSYTGIVSYKLNIHKNGKNIGHNDLVPNDSSFPTPETGAYRSSSYFCCNYDFSNYIPYWNSLFPDIRVNDSNGAIVLGGCGSWYVPPDNPPDWDAIKAMTPDARKAEIDRYIKDVLNVYTLQQHPELEPYLYYPTTPEPTEPTEPSIYDPDNEPSDLFGWLRLIVQAIISLISGIVRPVVNAINAVFGAISDGFAAILAFLGGLFTPDISIIQTEIDFVQAKFAFVGQIKLFINDFMGVLTGYDGSPPDVITVDFDNSNTGFLSNVVGKAVLIDLSWFTPYRLTVHAILSAMLWVFYLWRLFHQLPAVVAGQAAVEHMAEDAAKNP